MGWKTYIAAVLALTATATQAEETDATLRAYAAGYKAAFTCSGVFNAGKSLAQIKEHELTGIYPKIQPILDSLPDAVINQTNKTVSVEYASDMPPRISVHRGLYGCTQLPVGAALEGAKLLPVLPLFEDDNRSDTYPWKRSGTNTAIKEFLQTIPGNPEYGKDARTTALLVASPSDLVAEHYIEGFTPHTSQRTWSVAKSIAATAVGIVAFDGHVDVKAPATIANWQKPLDPRRAITLENILQMASGLDSNRAGNRTDRVYMGGGLVSDTATQTALEASPGTRWKYANNDTMLAVRAAREALEAKGLTLDPFRFLQKLGMNDTRLETDWEGNFIFSSQVWTTARDLARLGILHLQDGVWEGERILPEGWVDYIASPLGPQPPEKRADGSPIPGYGAQWWLYNERFKHSHPGIPTDTFAARGNRGQFLVVIPSRELVIVRRGYDMAGGEGFKLAKFIEDVLAALDES